ncbi:MAG: TetR/AcrR family transcriptional regulator [Aggregatilineales bacterium]
MADPTKKIDRRIQRTHELLRDALMALIEERGYERISIQDITDRANVSRTTFYLHFRDKDDLLFTTMEELYDNLVAQAHSPPPSETLSAGLNAGVDATEFLHVAAHAKFYRVMIGKQGSAAFVMRVQAYLARVTLEKMLKPLAERGTAPQLPLEFVAHGLAGMEIGLIRWWLEEDDLTHTAEEMALMMCRLSMLGTGWAVGLNLTPEMVPAVLFNMLEPTQSGSI